MVHLVENKNCFFFTLGPQESWIFSFNPRIVIWRHFRYFQIFVPLKVFL